MLLYIVGIVSSRRIQPCYRRVDQATLPDRQVDPRLSYFSMFLFAFRHVLTFSYVFIVKLIQWSTFREVSPSHWEIVGRPPPLGCDKPPSRFYTSPYRPRFPLPYHSFRHPPMPRITFHLLRTERSPDYQITPHGVSTISALHASASCQSSHASMCPPTADFDMQPCVHRPRRPQPSMHSNLSTQSRGSSRLTLTPVQDNNFPPQW